MRRICSFIVPLPLASCGSGDGGDDTATTPTTPAPPGPSPTPTPIAIPTPSPTPTLTDGYKKYSELSGTIDLPNAQTGFLTQYTPPAFMAFRSFGVGPAIRYDATARSYTAAKTTETFTAGDSDTTAPSGTQRYVNSIGHNLTVIHPSAGGRNLDYIIFARYMLELDSGQTTTAPFTASFLTGVATRGPDVPTQGAATFSRTVVMEDAYTLENGGAKVTYSLARSTLTMSVDYAAQKVTGRLSVMGTPTNGGADVTLSILSVTSDFSGVGSDRSNVI